MKGTIVKCLEELVIEKFGAGKWAEALGKAGMPKDRTFTAFCDVDDSELMVLMKGVADATWLSMEQVTELFGEHWSTVYAPKVYQAYYSGVKSARELLLNLDHIHEVMTRSVKFGRPPRFRYEWKDENYLIMHYESNRGMVTFMPALIRGVGKYYKEKLVVYVSGNEVHVRFLSGIGA